MKILAIDTSQKTVSVAILADGVLRADIFINSGRHHSEILLPAIEQVLSLAGLRLDEMNLFALTIGPGSFTGLRIGAATIKGLVLSTGKPVVGVSTLDALSLNAASVGQAAGIGRGYPFSRGWGCKIRSWDQHTFCFYGLYC
jgi:tRNA threonylcarbamoyladenosine biosynthesis protein TsaB